MLALLGSRGQGRTRGTQVLRPRHPLWFPGLPQQLLWPAPTAFPRWEGPGLEALAPPPVSETSLGSQEAFRRHRGLQLLALVEGVLPRHGHGRHGAWHISLSKPSEKEQHLLMALVGEQGEPGGARRGRLMGHGERGGRIRTGGRRPVCRSGSEGLGSSASWPRRC